MARPGRELAIAQGPQLAAQGLDADPDAERVPNPLRQVYQAPAHNAVERRGRAVLDYFDQRLALGAVQLGGLAWRLRVDQTLRAALVEAMYPIANRL